MPPLRTPSVPRSRSGRTRCTDHVKAPVSLIPPGVDPTHAPGSGAGYPGERAYGSRLRPLIPPPGRS